MKSVFSIFLFCLLFLECHHSPPGTIIGQVVEPLENIPLRGAVVKLRHSKFATRSDKDGNFMLSHVPSGTYDLECTLRWEDQDSILFPFKFRDSIFHSVKVYPDSTTFVALTLDSPSNRIDIFESAPINLPFLKPWLTLFRGYHGIFGHPSEGFEKAIGVVGRFRFLLLHRSDFKGRVEIKSSQDALSFVRLFTDADTHYLFWEHKAEDAFIEVLSATSKTSFGGIDRSMYRRLGLARPIVTVSDTCFLVNRYVLAYDRKLYRIVERVDPDGSYAITSRQLISSDSGVSLPAYY